MKNKPPLRYKKVVADFPVALFEETDRAAAEMNLSRSGIIRWAVEEVLKQRRRKKLRADIDEYFDRNAEAERSIMDDFKHMDFEKF